MNKRSFMRGFGTGVLFTAIILGVSCLIRTSDSQVVSRAKKLGMVYEKDTGNQKVAQSEATAVPTEQAGTEAPKATKEADSSKKTKAPQATETVTAPTPEKEDDKPEETKVPKETTQDHSLQDEKKKLEKEKEDLQKEAEQASKNLEIKVGEWSSDVSKRLQSMGIIKSATDFDKYLNDHGYSDSINAGTYQVSPGDTYQELARKITRR